MLTWKQARAHILDAVPTLLSEEVSLFDAPGRILRETITAPFDLPRFATSTMDGYALRSQDLQNATPESPARLLITQELAASQWSEETLQPGQCARIFTGAPLPPGADAVMMQEEVTREGQDALFSQPRKPGQATRAQGSECQQGTEVLSPGQRIGAGEIGILAGFGRAMVRVSRRPVVAVLASGSELRRAGETLRPGDIYESNRLALAAQIAAAGAIPQLLPLAPDQLPVLLEQIDAGLQADVLLTCGGASVGDHDLLRPALAQRDIEPDFWRVAVRPGKPLFFARHQRCRIFGLPGNPASAMVTFAIFVAPALRKMMGATQPQRLSLQATLTHPAKAQPKRTHFVRGKIDVSQQTPQFTPYPSQISGNLLSTRDIHALAVLPPRDRDYTPHEQVEVLWSGEASSS